jgi:hypothetical protein
MKTKYKILAMVPLMALVGCKKYEHKNVITGIGTVEKQKILLVNDVNTNQERIYPISREYEQKHPDVLEYLQTGDTVIFTIVVMKYSDSHYTKNLILDNDFVGMRYNSDSIYARQQREKFNQLKSEMQITR